MAGHDHGQRQAVEKQPVEHDAMDMTSEQMAVDVEAVESLEQVYSPYFDLQMALANDDLDAAVAALARVEEGVGSVDMSLFEGNAHMT